MFKSFKSLKTVRTLFDQAGNLYRVAKRVLEKVGSRFRSGYKRFAKNSLFYTEALPNVIGVTTSYTKGAGFESINQSQVSGLRSFSAYDIIGASSIDDQYLTFKPNVSSSDYPKPTFDPDDSVGAGIFTKSLWNHNLVFSSNTGFPGFPVNDVYIESVELDETPVEGATAWEVKSKQDRSSAANGIFAIGYDLLRASWDWDNYNIIFSLYVKFPDPDNLPTFIEVRVQDQTNPQRHSAFNIAPSDLSSGNWAYSSEDVGNGWYRVSYKTTLTGYNDGYTFNGDKLRVFSYLHYSGIGKKVWFAAPQIEQHPIRGLGDTNVYSSLDYAFEYDPDPHSGFAGTLSVWNVGNNNSGSDTGFEYRMDPFGKESVVALLKDGSPDASEGVVYNYSRYAVDRTTKHRVSFFFKRQRTGGTIELAMYNSRTKKVGTTQNWNFFQSSQHPTTTTLLNDNEWYLQVGYIHDTSTATTDATTGWYRLDGTKVDHGDVNFADLYFDPAYPSEPIGLMFRRFSAPHNDGNEIQIFGPRIDVVNGNEPSIQDLLNPVDNVNYGTVTKATPYVGNDAIPANVHRHNWLQYTDDLTDSYWTQNGGWTVEASTVGTTIFNGETCLSFSGHPTNYSPGSILKNISTSDLSFDLNERYVFSIYFKQGNDPATAASAIEMSCDDGTNPYAGYTLRLVFNTYGGPPARLNGSTSWGYEDVGDGWYRIWVRTPGGSYSANTLNGDVIKIIAGLQVRQNNHQGFFMRPMLERLPIDQAESDPPTAYQEVPDNTWPSVSAIPYHQVAKEVELSIKDDTTGSSYTAKAYWDGGKLYNYGPRIANQDVEITQLQDGWHKFGTGIRGLGDGTINAGDTASMTFSYAASSNPRSKTLISGPILANTGSEKSSKVNYSVGTQTPGVNFIVDTVNWDDYFGGSFLTPANPNVITMDKINTPGPYDPSSFIFSSDEGVQQSRDYVLYYPYNMRNEVKFSDSDTVVTHLHAKSLWNYNELPYTRNILDDPFFTDGSDQYGSFYSHSRSVYSCRRRDWS